MELNDYILMFVATCINNVFIMLNYKLYDKKCIVKTSMIKNITIIFFFSTLGFVNFYLNMSIFRTLISFIIWLLQNFLVYKESINKCFLKTLLSYSTYMFFEIIFSITIMALNLFNVEKYFSKIWVVVLFTIVVIIFTYCFTMLLMKILKKAKYNAINNRILWFIETCIIIFIVLLSYKNFLSINLNDYIINVILYIIIGLITIIIFKQNNKIVDSHNKNNAFLDFMKTYEKQADKDSEFRHEIFNNLIIMKSLSNKKQVNELIEEILNKYDNNLTNKYKNIFSLPSGIKGIIYYKVFELQNENAIVDLHISNKVNKVFKKLSIKDYKDIAEVLTILLDNSIEAIKKNRNKEMGIYLYADKNEINIEISNSITKKIDIKNIEKMGFSTKGKKRGLGLYIARNIINSNKNFDLKYKIENQRFYSNFTIKSKTI